MILGGFQKNSLIDYPGKISSVIFTKGCNFKCPYCHNHELISFEKNDDSVDTDSILSFLNSRKGFIDGVVITGGEPTLQKDIIDFAGEIKKMGFPLKMDTNGSRPEILEKLVEKKLVDLFAMDIKAPFSNYKELTYEKDIAEKLESSINLLMNAETDYLFRTTCAKPFITKTNCMEIFEHIKGADNYYLQTFKRDNVYKKDFFNSFEDYTEDEMRNFKKTAVKFVKICKLI
ncbi:MAG: anaerobic ribonucleoside-triphosphate reductase activating protein [Deltaproteobacteria bacterium]|nr:MAG: anaerobic ribonucleoside-triphosphate reductase activating protein [Deltaproteobacteria bacterium]